MARGGTPSPKREVLTRLDRIVEGLREGGNAEEAAALASACASLRASVPRNASIQEVIQRALAAIVASEETLGGRLVDALAHIGRRYGAVLAMHPALLVVVALGGQDNPDRADPERNRILDSLLATLLSDPEPYQESLYTLAVLARTTGLEETAEAAVTLLEEIHQHGATTMADQARAVEARIEKRPEVAEGDDFGWVVKILLTLATLALVTASASKFVGSLRDVLSGIEDVLDTVLGD